MMLYGRFAAVILFAGLAACGTRGVESGSGPTGTTTTGGEEAEAFEPMTPVERMTDAVTELFLFELQAKGTQISERIARENADIDAGLCNGYCPRVGLPDAASDRLQDDSGLVVEGLVYALLALSTGAAELASQQEGDFADQLLRAAETWREAGTAPPSEGEDFAYEVQQVADRALGTMMEVVRGASRAAEAEPAGPSPLCLPGLAILEAALFNMSLALYERAEQESNDDEMQSMEVEFDENGEEVEFDENGEEFELGENEEEAEAEFAADPGSSDAVYEMTEALQPHFDAMSLGFRGSSAEAFAAIEAHFGATAQADPYIHRRRADFAELLGHVQAICRGM